MRIAGKNKRPIVKKKSWEPFSSGYESTRSPEIIDMCLARLTDKGAFISLAQKGYKSGPTVLVGFDQEQLMVDKPVDWPGNKSSIRISFRDSSKLLVHCFVPLISSKDDTLVVRKPMELFRLQRRRAHRVDAPYGSRVSFNYRGLKSKKFIIKNISAGGLLFCARKQLQLTGATISDISVNIPLNSFLRSQEKDSAFQVDISSGEVVRACHDSNSDFFCYGVSFLSKSGEEESVAKYVRFRELELLRTGVFP